MTLVQAARDRIELNGREPDQGELAFLAQVNYGHFTSLQVRDRGTRGFSLHLQRLADATRLLFGNDLDTALVRRYVRQILDDAPASLRITVFSSRFDRANPERMVAADVLVAARAPREISRVPLRLKSVVHERLLPGTKHVGTFDLFHHRRLARMAGFDDAVFCTASGEISEGTIWNLGFWDGRTVTWPGAPALPGITRQLVDAGLRELGIPTTTHPVHLGDLAGFNSAFILNSGSVGPLVRSIDGARFVLDAEFEQLLVTAYESQPLEAI